MSCVVGLASCPPGGHAAPPCPSQHTWDIYTWGPVCRDGKVMGTGPDQRLSVGDTVGVCWTVDGIRFLHNGRAVYTWRVAGPRVYVYTMPTPARPWDGPSSLYTTHTPVSSSSDSPVSSPDDYSVAPPSGPLWVVVKPLSMGSLTVIEDFPPGEC